MPRPSKRKQSLQQNAQKATQARKRKAAKEDSDSEPIGHGDVSQDSDAAPPVLPQDNDIPHPPSSALEDPWDFDFGNELPDLDCDALSGDDSDSELDDEVVAAPEISNETALTEFATLLHDTQEAACIRERDETSRPKHYKGNSTSTKYRHRKTAKRMAKQGFLNVFDFMARFISAYAQGLTGADLVWIKKKYRGHRMLPPAMVAEIKASMAA
ncbi:hypothetical protein C8R46DRAFT_1357944 [Mycena filopes]|nr:hypothetical protein C8R46DRAFT_1357944 [Mycena filopes]